MGYNPTLQGTFNYNFFFFLTLFFKNKLPLNFKRGERLVFAYIFASYFEYSKYVEKIKQRKSHLSKKSFSNNSEEFIKWFVGFSDAESNFSIVLYKDKTAKILYINFRFLIELHVDDIDDLKLIKSKLNIGNDIAV